MNTAPILLLCALCTVAAGTYCEVGRFECLWTSLTGHTLFAGAGFNSSTENDTGYLQISWVAVDRFSMRSCHDGRYLSSGKNATITTVDRCGDEDRCHWQEEYTWRGTNFKNSATGRYLSIKKNGEPSTSSSAKGLTKRASFIWHDCRVVTEE